jgi:arabinofuranosyltransferase
MTAGGWVPLALGLRRGGHNRGLWVLVAIVTAGVVNFAYVVAIGGDYEHARLFLPALFALCAPIAVIPLARAHVAAIGLAPWALFAVVSLRPPVQNSGETFVLPNAGRVTTNDYRLGNDQVKALLNETVIYQSLFGKAHGSYLPLAADIHRPVAVVGAIGLMPYALGQNLYVFDVLGLADPVTAHLQIPVRKTLLPYPGHEKELPRPWIAARLIPPGTKVDPNQLPFIETPNIEQTTGAAFQQQVADARAALHCAPVKRLERSANAPLTVGQFLRNIADSFSNTTLRISPDPEIAQHQLCGDNISKTTIATAGDRVTADFAIRAVDESGDAAATAAATRCAPEPPQTADRPQRVVSASGFV